jgi:hypothetical protein
MGSGLAIIHLPWYAKGMARPIRIELAGGLYHVTARDNRLCSIARPDPSMLQDLTLYVAICTTKRFCRPDDDTIVAPIALGYPEKIPALPKRKKPDILAIVYSYEIYSKN